MSAILHPAAQRINASVAGHTNVLEGPPPGAPAPISPTELVASVVHGAGGALDFINAGGSHPEHVLPTPVTTDLARATHSTEGRLGGLVPHASGTAAPGPAGAVATARAAVANVRKRLRI